MLVCSSKMRLPASSYTASRAQSTHRSHSGRLCECGKEVTRTRAIAWQDTHTDCAASPNDIEPYDSSTPMRSVSTLYGLVAVEPPQVTPMDGCFGIWTASLILISIKSHAHTCLHFAQLVTAIDTAAQELLVADVSIRWMGAVASTAACELSTVCSLCNHPGSRKVIFLQSDDCSVIAFCFVPIRQSTHGCGLLPRWLEP